MSTTPDSGWSHPNSVGPVKASHPKCQRQSSAICRCPRNLAENPESDSISSYLAHHSAIAIGNAFYIPSLIKVEHNLKTREGDRLRSPTEKSTNHVITPKQRLMTANGGRDDNAHCHPLLRSN
jgi:hypothetical protein